MTWAICFDFPDVPDPLFAGEPLLADPMNLTVRLSAARRWRDENEASAVLESHLFAEFGAVVEIAA